MKTMVQSLSARDQAAWQSQVKAQLRHLDELTTITSAEVVLEQMQDGSPAYRVRIQLEVPGPGPEEGASRRERTAAEHLAGPPLHAEATDPTIEAALLKVTRELERQVQSRNLARPERSRGRLQPTALSSRWTHSRPGDRPPDRPPVAAAPRSSSPRSAQSHAVPV